MMGPGKHDQLCTMVREQLGMRDSGGVLLIVIGDGVNGFSCQADLATTLRVPEMLESIAAQIRADIAGGRL